MIKTPGRIIEGATAWETVFAAPHKFEYLFEIDGEAYTLADMSAVPLLERSLMEKPCLGKCVSSTIKLNLRPKQPIPKGATVVVHCRAVSAESGTSWFDLGTFKISTRSESSSVLTLVCRDYMAKAGQTYLDKTVFTEWPVQMSQVISEIAQIMEVEIDPRTQINETYTVDYPNEDCLMSEVLSMCAAAHGGFFMMTPQNKLRLLVYPNAGTAEVVQDLGTAYTRFKKLSTHDKFVSRITLNDIADNQFTAGDDTGIELTGDCDYANQRIADTVFDTLSGTVYRPFELEGAYLDPRMELGDAFSLSDKGVNRTLIAGNIKIHCGKYITCSVMFGIADDDEEEFPYISTRDLQADRYVSTTKAYFGNRINRRDGFVSEYVKDDQVVARFTANANLFSMQQKVDNAWKDRIYFDPVAGKYKITGDVEIEGKVTFEDLATRGKTTIHGDNITTGTLNTNQVKIAGSDNFMWNEDYIVAKNPSNTNQQIRYGKYDGSHMGIAFTQDGGKTWQSAIGFNGITLQAGSVTKAMLASDIDFTYIHDSTTAPSNPANGALWFDSSSSPGVLKRYDAANQKWNVVAENYETRFTTVEQAIKPTSIVSTVTQSTTYINAMNGKVSTDKVISCINQTAESVKISAKKIQFSGEVITDASLKTGNWSFNSNGSSYENGSIEVNMTVMSGNFVGGGTRTRAFYGSSNCDVQYGADYGYKTFIRSKAITIVAHNNGDMSDTRMATFSKYPGPKDYEDFTFYCNESDYDSPAGNLGYAEQPWDTIYVNTCLRLTEKTFSSKHVKHDIAELPEMGELLDALIPVSFKYNYKHAQDQLRYGLILEDTAKVLPAICTVPDYEEGSAEYLSEAAISYSDLIAPMLKEIQSLRKRVKTLEDSHV